MRIPAFRGLNAQSTRHGARPGPALAPWCARQPLAFPRSRERQIRLATGGESKNIRTKPIGGVYIIYIQHVLLTPVQFAVLLVVHIYIWMYLLACSTIFLRLTPPARCRESKTLIAILVPDSSDYLLEASALSDNCRWKAWTDTLRVVMGIGS